MPLKALDIESSVPIKVDSALLTERISPSGADIRTIRLATGLTQKESASIVGLSHGSRWSEFESGNKRLDPARWELFLIKTGRHPKFEMNRRPVLEEEVLLSVDSGSIPEESATTALH